MQQVIRSPVLTASPWLANLAFPTRLLRLGKTKATERQLEKIISASDKVLRESSNEPLAYYNRARAYLEAENFTQAINDNALAIEFNPNFVEAFNNRGIAYQNRNKNGDLDHAISSYNEALDVNPKYVEAISNRAVAHRHKGEISLCISDLKEAIQLNPTYGIAYYNLATTYAEIGNFDLALANFREAIRIDPENSNAITNRGFVYAARGEIDLAIADCHLAIRLNPKDAIAFNNLGTLHLSKGETERATIAFSKAIELGGSSQAFFNRALVFRDRGETDLALADYSEAIRVNPYDAESFLSRGNIYANRYESDLAIADFNHAIRLDPDNAKAFNNRGVCHHDKGNIEAAIADYNEALRLDPSDSIAIRNHALALQGKYFDGTPIIESIVSTNISNYTGSMLRDNIRDALEKRLDRLREEYELSLGSEAANEAFARRASAGGDGVLDPDMGARGVLRPAAGETTSSEPIHPGHLVRALMEERKVTVTALAKKLGITRNHFHSVLSGKSKVTAEMAVIFEECFGTPALEWCSRQSRYDLAQIQAQKIAARPESLQSASSPETAAEIEHVIASKVAPENGLLSSAARPKYAKLVGELSGAELEERREKERSKKARFRLKQSGKAKPAAFKSS